MNISWGWKVGFLYVGFIVLIMTLVIASSRQHFDLVSNDYYEAELNYQKVIDAGKNQAALSRPVSIYANGEAVIISFPDEFKSKVLSGNIRFYSPVNAEWDRSFDINTRSNNITIARSDLHNTRYIIKINCSIDGKDYYQESEIMLHS